ncbi:acyltransferase [Pseudogemmatithrix spongiicola]|uniref:Acyltransferase n=1 Tax=Pseudogemmatithrix spongiicola TaxID=3062599 RepID=A0AA49JVQ0_9BACT|nr:acyltransferase [Gemmatimonadaceae bacterium 'strain 138']WKW15692.1 acyltransferase [Gemmatimonadaceae bacterium 'strain 318']
MPRIPLQKLPARATESIEDAWIANLSEKLSDASTDRALLCRDTLLELAYPQYVGRYEATMADLKTPLGTQLALAALDPRNVTLEPEYYGDCDQAKFQRVKPLLWLWYSFDRLPIGGQAVQQGVKLRRALAPHIFKRVGKNFKCFQHVEFSFGYNMEVGDDVVVHRHVLLDDRGGIRMGNRVSISDYANIYSHTHSIVEQVDVTNALTILDDDVRITYHATVLAGVHVRENGMVGAVAVATKDVRPYHVNVGIPAKSVRVKPNAPAERTSLAPERTTE